MKNSICLMAIGSVLLSALAGNAALAAKNSGAPAHRSAPTSAHNSTRQLDAYRQSFLQGDASSIALEGVSVGLANLQVSEVTSRICGSPESGDAGCVQRFYKTETAVEVRLSVESSTSSSEQSGSSLVRVYFRLSDFTAAELAAIQKNDVGFDPFGSAYARSRTLSRQLFQISLRQELKKWNEPVFGNKCHFEGTGSEDSREVCNVVGTARKSRLVNVVVVSKR